MCAKKVRKEKDTRPGSSFLRAPAHKGPYMWVRICDHSITRAHEALHALWRQAPLFMAHVRAGYPDASYELPKIHDFQKFVAVFASAGPGAERARSRSPKRS